tara:strand:- start:2261 stop:2464 length:204 start_codon:yes stop_codon:yes gene_type:complete
MESRKSCSTHLRFYTTPLLHLLHSVEVFSYLFMIKLNLEKCRPKIKKNIQKNVFYSIFFKKYAKHAI